MEEIFKESVKSAPEAAAILVVVFVFLRAMSKRDKDYNVSRDRHAEANREQAERWSTALRDLVREQMMVIKDCASSIATMKELLQALYRDGKKR